MFGGQLYSFQVRVKNKYEWGYFGLETSIYTAAVPEAPVASTTAQSDVKILIYWIGPDANGLTVTSYKILILAADGSTWATTIACDGSDDSVVSSTSCEVHMNTLRAATSYELVLNNEVMQRYVLTN